MYIQSLLISILISLSCNAHASNESTLWQMLISLVVGTQEPAKPQHPHEYTKQIDYDKVKTCIENIINPALGIATQPWHVKQKAIQARETIANAIIDQLKTKKLHYQGDAEVEAKSLTYAALVQHIGEQSEQYAKERIKQFSRPPSINPQIIAEDIKVKVIDRVDQSWDYKRNSYCSLCPFYGDELKNFVRESLKNYEPQQDFYYPVQPSAPPAEPLKPENRPVSNDIYEIYPAFSTLERNKEFHAKREQDKLHREEECTVCLENFKDIGKRVTLFCGHSICATCLFGLLFLRNDYQCPLCRKEIQTAEFGIGQLQPHIKLDLLKAQFPNDHAKIRAYFPWG